MTKKRALPLVLLLVGTLAAWRGMAAPDAAELLGTWQVDLLPTPDAPAYYQPFVVTSVEGDSIQGTFYGSPIQRGRLNTAWGAVHFAFVTSDGSGPYNHSGRIVDGRLEGSTYATGRGFLLPWRAERAAPSR